MRFVSISANNLDEFFMVRVAGLKGQLRAGVTTQSADGLTPSEQLEEIATLAQHLQLEQQDHWQTLREELFAKDVVIHEADDLVAGSGQIPAAPVPRGDLPGADADRGRSGAPVPVHPQSRASRWPSS